MVSKSELEFNLKFMLRLKLRSTLKLKQYRQPGAGEEVSANGPVNAAGDAVAGVASAASVAGATRSVSIRPNARVVSEQGSCRAEAKPASEHTDARVWQT